MSTDLEARLARLENLEQIHQLAYSYNRLLDARSNKELSELFTEDGVYILQTKVDASENSVALARTPAEIEGVLTNIVGVNPPAPGATRYHLVATPNIEIQGDRATGHWLWWQVERTDDPLAAPRLDSVGHYEDEYVLVDGTWKFKRREAFCDIPYIENKISNDV
jgi:hypothetical protein